ncbi:hypothetical protein MMC24_004476 [Lignoscripta atroalba]|nr:hypothetical protein [Lignoscripta atroalba]
MATVLGMLYTDAPIHPPTLQNLVTHAVDRSFFNSIFIDRDTSTNDTVAIFANGAPGGLPIASLDKPDAQAMQDVLTSFTQDLAQVVVRVRVINTASFPDAKAITSSIARSPPMKTALYGKDAK